MFIGSKTKRKDDKEYKREDIRRDDKKIRKDDKENAWPNSASIESDQNQNQMNGSQKSLKYNSCSRGSQDLEDDPKQQCKYHQNKKTKYKVVSVPYCNLSGTMAKYCLCDLVCSKCAVNLVATGFKVEEMDLDRNQLRQEEIQNFLITVQSSFRDLDYTEQQLLDKRSNLLRFCERQQDKVKEYYQKIVSTLEQRLQEQLSVLSEAHNRVSLRFETYHTDLREQHAELLQMYSDIEVNVESIIHGIEQLPYRQIMGQYQRRVQQVQSGITRLQEEQVQLPRVFMRRSPTHEMVLGGMVEDTELEIRMVQTGLLKSKNGAGSSRVLLSPSPSTGFTSPLNEVGVASQMASPITNNSPLPTQKYYSSNLQKHRSMSQPTYGNQKYLEILQKVNDNQIKTNDYYSSILRNQANSNQNSLIDEQQSNRVISILNSRNSPQSEYQHKQYQSPKFK